ncbi:hypothetical protein D3C76_1647970 [compost metagenome]
MRGGMQIHGQLLQIPAVPGPHQDVIQLRRSKLRQDRAVVVQLLGQVDHSGDVHFVHSFLIFYVTDNKIITPQFITVNHMGLENSPSMFHHG